MAERVDSQAVATDRITLGDLVAFVTLQLMLIWPIDAMGYIIANAQEAMTAADLIARLVIRPAEIPMGIITAALGAPFLLYLLRVHR